MSTIKIQGNVYNALRCCIRIDDVRYGIRGMLVDFANDMLVATDGHRLLKHEIDKAENEYAADLPARTVAPSTRKADREGLIVIEISDDPASVDYMHARITLFSKTGKQKWAEVVEIIDTQFPDYSKVIPPWNKAQRGNKIPAVVYNPILIGEVVAALNPKGCAAAIYPTDPKGTGPLLVDLAGFPKAHLILMPMRWDAEVRS